MADNKPDFAHERTDEILREFEKRVSEIYLEAHKSVSKKLSDYLRKFEQQDKQKLELLKSGKITEQEYRQWRFNKIAVGRRWQRMADTLAQDYTNANEIAAGIVNDDLDDVFALNANYMQYSAEQMGYSTGTSFTLYDRNTVAKLIKEQPDLLPKTSVDIPKDLRWNSKKITSAVTQGLLTGESIPKIANRLQSITTMNKVSAIRNRRTTVTAAQNKGRIYQMEKQIKAGIRVQKEWLATQDGRTRHSHALLDGERVDVDKKFSNGLMYPGDPEGAAEEVYNCRCTLVYFYPDFQKDLAKTSYDAENFDEAFTEFMVKEKMKWQ